VQHAIKHSFSGIIRNLVRSDLFKIDYQFSAGNTVLHLSVRNGSSPYFLSKLIDNQADIESKNDLGATPLLTAVYFNQIQAVQFLIERKANIEAREKAYKQTPLMIAASCGHRSIVELLVRSGANTGAVDRDGWNAFSIASSKRFPAIAAFLQTL